MPQYDGTLKFDTKIDQAGFKKSLKKLGGIAKGTFKGMAKGAAALGGVMTAAAGGAVALIEKTKELNGDLGKFNANVQASGKDQAFMNEQLKRFTAITGEADSSVEGLSNLLRTTYKEERLTQVLDGLAGAIVAFPDTLKFESLSDSLQETLATGKGVGQFAELLERSGQNLEEFNDLMAKAPDQMTKNTIALEALNKTGLAKLAKNYEEANKDQLDYSKNQQELQRQLGELAGEFTPIINSIMPVIIRLMGRLKDKIKLLINPIKDFVNKFVDAVSGVRNAGQDLIAAFTDILLNIKNKVIEIVPKIVNEMKGIITKATDYFKSDEGKEALGKAMQTLFSDAMALLKEIPDLIRRVGDFLGAVIDAFFEDENTDKMYNGIVDFFEYLLLELTPALIEAGGKIALKLIGGIVGELKRGERKVRETLKGWGIGSTAKEGLGSYGDSYAGTEREGVDPGIWQHYLSTQEAARKRGEDANYSYADYVAAGHHAPSWAAKHPDKVKGNININISGNKVLNPVDTAREVKKVFTTDLARSL